MGKHKSTHNPLGAGMSDSAENIPPQTSDSESEFSVNQSIAEDHAKEQQQQSGKKAKQQQSGAGSNRQDEDRRSSESEFSQDGSE